ncbi:NAD(P)-dependent dehydrogenase (short-subunit alcohol dehydrogenase family) [Bradyrhizobium sp. GM24.11]
MRSVLITGANRAIGLALSASAQPGVRVFACCRDPGRADKLGELIAPSGSRLQTAQLGVANEASIASFRQY